MAPLLRTLDAGILTLTFNRPEKRNALSAELIEALHEALDQAELDAGVRVVALRGAGTDFCAGADLDELLASAEHTLADNEQAALRLGLLFQRCRQLLKPVVAIVRGRALGGGAGLVTACDLAIAAESAAIGYPELQRGFVPATVMVPLRRLVGEKLALDLLLTGRLLSSAEAVSVGLLTRVVEDAALDAAAAALLTRLAETSGSAVGLTKQLFYRLDDLTFAQGITQAARVNALARQTPDFRDGISRFLRR